MSSLIVVTDWQTLQRKALERLDTSPREACDLARAAHDQARAGGDARVQAETALTLASALNRLGEFREALLLAEHAATFWAQCGESEQAARGLCEAGWAQTFLGDLKAALGNVERARAHASSLVAARCDWIQARVLRDQGHYSAAAALFEKARAAFESAQLPLDAVRCERELAHVYVLSNQPLAPALLEQVRQVFESAHCAGDVALCDYLLAVSLLQANRYLESAESLVRVRARFVELGMHFHAAWCDNNLGICYRQLNRFDESLRAAHQGRDYFLTHHVQVEVSACDITLGNTYYALNRYDEALMLYQEAADLALAEGRVVRAARIHGNMARIYARQGSFARSLSLHQRAYQVFLAQALPVPAAISAAHLATVYRQLGQHIQAIEHLRRARAVFAEQHLSLYLAECDVALAEVHLAAGESAAARLCLEQARRVCEANGLDSLRAMCDRLLARIVGQDGEHTRALALIAQSRATFLQHTQIVDVALCDLTEGELRLESQALSSAAGCFARACAVLDPSFPDYAWRVHYGLGRCAAAAHDHSAALGHYLNAVRTIATSRSALVTEQLSNDFFARRASVYEDALALALQQDARESVLEIIEASKARVFLTLLQNYGWKLRPARKRSPLAQDLSWQNHGRRTLATDADPYVADLIARERGLRYQLDALRRRIAAQTEEAVGEPLRGGDERGAISAAALEELNALSATYEAVVTQLRLTAAGLAGVSAPEPFSLEKFREATSARLGMDWAALDYYLADDYLIVVTVTPQGLCAERKTLSDYDRSILNQCVTADADLRELIYRGTLHGARVPSPGADYLQHLCRLLIPQELDAATLIVAPHRALHALPFHALMRGDAYLIEQHTLVYVPSLQVAQLLFGAGDGESIDRALVLGLSDFGDTLRALPYAAEEVAMLREVFDGRGEYLWGAEATRQKLLDLDAAGELREFDLLHFATHAVLDNTAPHQSRVVLSDDALTATDVSDLTLDARVVTLSACQTALSQGGQGDELVSLARAFFYAGARALLATLWHVEDHSMVDLTRRFYRHWAVANVRRWRRSRPGKTTEGERLRDGDNLAAALRHAQIEMLRLGYPPYQWASFLLMGRP